MIGKGPILGAPTVQVARGAAGMTDEPAKGVRVLSAGRGVRPVRCGGGACHLARRFHGPGVVGEPGGPGAEGQWDRGRGAPGASRGLRGAQWTQARPSSARVSAERPAFPAVLCARLRPGLCVLAPLVLAAATSRSYYRYPHFTDEHVQHGETKRLIYEITPLGRGKAGVRTRAVRFQGSGLS